MRPRRLPPVLALLVVALALVAVACGDEDEDKEGSVQPQGDQLVLTLGTENFTESILVGEIYRQALRQEGINVRLRKDIGAHGGRRQGARARHDRRLPRVPRRGAHRRRGTGGRRDHRGADVRVGERSSTRGAMRRSASRRRSRTSTRSRPPSSSPSAVGWRPSVICAHCHGSPSAPGPSSRSADRAWSGCARSRTGSTTRGSSRSRSASSTARSTASRSTPRTSSPPTGNSRAAATRCSRTPTACSDSSMSHS